MSEQKQWISHDEIEVTKPVSDFVSIENLRVKISSLKNNRDAMAAQLVELEASILQAEGELADLLSTPDRPKEAVVEVPVEEIIDPLFVAEKPQE